MEAEQSLQENKMAKKTKATKLKQTRFRQKKGEN